MVYYNKYNKTKNRKWGWIKLNGRRIRVELNKDLWIYDSKYQKKIKMRYEWKWNKKINKRMIMDIYEENKRKNDWRKIYSKINDKMRLYKIAEKELNDENDRNERNKIYRIKNELKSRKYKSKQKNSNMENSHMEKSSRENTDKLKREHLKKHEHRKNKLDELSESEDELSESDDDTSIEGNNSDFDSDTSIVESGITNINSRLFDTPKQINMDSLENMDNEYNIDRVRNDFKRNMNIH